MAASYLLPESPCRRLEDYCAGGLDGAAAIARDRTPAQLLAVIESSGLRGRDHAATGVGAKWAAVAGTQGDDLGPRYLVANATDAEPGSFTDRALLRANPFAVIEGIAVSARALRSRDAFLVLRRSSEREYEIVADAIAAAETAGWLETVSIKCVRVDDAYLLTDERALLETIEGRPPVPCRLGPDVDGLFAYDHRDRSTRDRPPSVPNPTVVETIETLANVAAITVGGAAWFRSMGTAVSPGNVLCTITGDVERHGVIEAELGRRLYDVIEEGGGGFLPTSPPKAVLSGVSSPVLTRSRLAAPLSWEGLGAVGANLGRAAFLVYGEPTDMVEVARQASAYLAAASCGLCPPCSFGGGEVAVYLERLASGTAEPRDVEAIGQRLASIGDGRRCDLPTRHRDVVSSIMRAFPGDMNDAVATSAAGRPVVPVTTGARIGDLVDLDGGRAVWAGAPSPGG